MRDYNIEEVTKIINRCKEYQIKESRHFNIRNVQRIFNLETVYDCLLKKEMVGILKQDHDKFIVFYEYEKRKSKDLAIVVRIEGNLIYLITVFLSPRGKRVK